MAGSDATSDYSCHCCKKWRVSAIRDSWQWAHGTLQLSSSTAKNLGRYKLGSIKQWPRVAQLVFCLVLALASIVICVGTYRWLVMGALEYWFSLSGEASVTIRRIGTIAMLFIGYWLFAQFYERRLVSREAVIFILC